MRHNPVCFTGHRRGSTLTINCLASFLVLWRGSSASPRNWRARAGFGVDLEFYGEVCLGESYRGQLVFRFSASARLCRITPPRNSSGCCHGAGIRHDPGFGITAQVMRGEPCQTAADGSLLYDGPDHFRREAVSPHSPRLVDGSKQRA
jgi:hypothetical protein